MDDEVENLLRPPIEWLSAVSQASLAVIIAGVPAMLLMPVQVAYGVAASLVAVGGKRWAEGVKLIQYQRRLYVLPKFAIAPGKIPVNDQWLYLGLGFEWKAQHVQRRMEIYSVRGDKFLNERPVYLAMRRGVEKVKPKLPRWLQKSLDSQSLLNPFPARPYIEGDPTLHAVGLYEGEKPVCVQQSERNAHMFVCGTTRVGKTRLLEVLVTQDIRAGNVVIVFDPKGDGDLLARIYSEAEKAGRLSDLYIFHLGFPELSARYNPVGDFGRVTEVASRVAGQLPDSGNSSAFREFAWRYVNVIAKAMVQLGEKATYQAILQYGSDVDTLIKKYLENHLKRPGNEALYAEAIALYRSEQKQGQMHAGRDRLTWAYAVTFKRAGQHDEIALSLLKIFEHDKSHYDKLVASLFPLLEKLTTGKVAELISPDYDDLDDTRPIFDWLSVIRSGGIVYVGLDALSDPDVAGAVAPSMFADLTSVAGEMYKHGVDTGLPGQTGLRRKICIHADEFNELVGTEFVPLANKAGGAGFQITAYTQTLSDIIVRFGDTARAGQVIGNLGTLVFLRIKEPATAELLTTRLREVEVNQLTVLSGSADESRQGTGVHFTSSTEQRRTSQKAPLLGVADLDVLPKGHAYVLAGGKLFKVRLPLFDDDAELTPSLADMVARMKRNYPNDNSWQPAAIGVAHG